jgi:hypothetical protein
MAPLPQRLLEKVFTPWVVHSHIWLPDGLGAGWVCAAPRLCAALGAMVAGAVIAGAPVLGVLGSSWAVARVGTVGVDWVDACAGVVLPVKPTARAIAMAAIDNALKIHGRRSLSSVIARLSSCCSVRAANMTDCY